MSKEELIKCLLSYETSHHVIYLSNQNQDNFLSFHQFKLLLINQYDDLIKKLNLDFNQIYFEIFDLDFQQFVNVDQHTKIKNLDKLKVIKRSAWNQMICDENCLSCLNCSNKNASNAANASNISNNSKRTNLKDNSLNENQDYLINKNEINRNLNNSNQSNCSTNSKLSSKLSLNRSNQLNSSNTSTKSVTLKNSSIDTSNNQTTDHDKRIIHLKDNLFKERCLKFESDYHKLIEENKRLLAKLELYKKTSNSMANTTTYLDSIVTNSDELERLRKELTELKENQESVIEGFKKKSNEFRRVVCKLTGFRFYALEQSKYKLNHIYSNPNEFLFFSYEKEDDAWNLFANEFSEKFYEQIDTYLNEYGSYPAFLASITLKLWEEERDKQQSIKK